MSKNSNKLRAACCLITIVTVLFYTLQLSAAERDLTIDSLVEGAYAVGSNNFTIDDVVLNEKLALGLDAGQFQQGYNLNGDLLCISDLLAYPQESFNFQLAVPNDSSRYGESAGTTLPYAGYIFYPTTDSNARQNYDMLGSTLPHMQDTGDAPIFADENNKYPLIVYSHGGGDFPNSFKLDFLTNLASHGYIVLALYHCDNRFLISEARTFNLRTLAVKTAIDELLSHADFTGHIDADRIGGTGESFGGATMLALLGAKTVAPDAMSVYADTLEAVTVDPRIKAAATMVPYFGSGFYAKFGRTGSGTATVDRPFLANASNADEEADYTMVQAGMNNIPGVKYLVEYEGEPHSMSEAAFNDAYTWSKIFLDANIKKDADAINTLSRLQAVNASGVDKLVLVTEPDVASPNRVANTAMISMT